MPRFEKAAAGAPVSGNSGRNSALGNGVDRPSFRKFLPARQASLSTRSMLEGMVDLVKLVVLFARDLFQSQASLEAEIILLGHQTSVLQRGRTKDGTGAFDGERSPGVRGALSNLGRRVERNKYCEARNRCALVSAWAQGVLALDIKEKSRANPLWCAPRIHGELLKLGLCIAQSTVSNYMLPPRGRPSQSWRNFLHNHLAGIAAVECFIVQTVCFKRLDRRRPDHVAVTAHPTAEWMAQKIRQGFPWDEAPGVLIRDRDSVYGAIFRKRLRCMGIRDRPVAPRSPWQNGYVER